MLRYVLPLIAGLFVGPVWSQTVSSVVFSPSTINACDLVNMTVVGTYPANNYEGTGFNFNIVADTLLLKYFAEPMGPGNQVVTPFAQPLPTVGPWPAGNYVFRCELYLNNMLADTWTSTRVVGAAPSYDPGVDTLAVICNAGPSFPLLTLMGGNPDPGGQWIDPFNQPHGPTFVPGVDMAGLWLYQFDLNPPCQDTTAQLFISYLPNNDPGIGGNLPLCVTGQPVDLFTELQGTPQSNGTWTGPGGTPFSGVFDPATDPSGPYSYSVPGLPPCPSPSATINVTVNQVPEAGTGGTAMICETDTAFLLYGELTGSQPGGIWYDPTGNVFGTDTALFDATIHPPGLYVYLINLAPCPADEALLEVEIDSLPCGVGILENDPRVAEFRLMPNPTDGLLTYRVRLTDKDHNTRIEVTDALGNVVRTIPLNGRQEHQGEVDLTGQPAGVYLVRLLTSTGATVQRVVLH